MKSASLFALFVLAFGSACLSTEGPAYAERTSVPQLAGSALTLRLIDARPAIDSEEVSITAFTMPHQEQELALPPDPALEATLREALARELVPAPRSLHLEVTLRSAFARWDAGWLTETEHARTELGITVRDENDRVLASGTTDSWASRSSLDTSETAMRRIFDRVLRDALFRFLASAEGAPLRAAEDRGP